MRALDGNQDAAISQRFTKPQYLVEITLDRTYYLSTRAIVNWAGQTWVPGMIVYGSLSEPGDSFSLQIYNGDGAFSEIAGSGALQTRRVLVWSAYPPVDSDYVEPGYWESGYASAPMPTPVLVFDGFIRATPRYHPVLFIECYRPRPRMLLAKRMRAPEFNHCPSPGTVFAIGGGTIVIEKA